MNPLKKTWIGKSGQRLPFYLFLLLCFTCISLLIVNSVFQQKEHLIEDQTVTETEEVLKEQPEPQLQVVPNEKTEFFSKEGGKPLLYYAIVNDSIKFFKKDGVEPVTGQKLLPVTQKIIDIYQESIVPKKEVAMVDTRNYRVNEVKIIKKKEKPKENKPKRESIWNTQLLNSSTEDEISLFVFNQRDELDQNFMHKLKSEFVKKGYFVTDEVIFSDMMNPEIAQNLKSANTKYFDYNLKKYTDYICIVNVFYSYAENAYRNDFLDCTATISYFIYDAATGQQMFSEEDQLIGSGQTKSTARKEAIQKFIL